MTFEICIDPERCKGCELCVGACPLGILTMSENLNLSGQRVPKPDRPDRCTGCRQCATICPEAAIEIAPRDNTGQSEPTSRSSAAEAD